MNNHTPSLKDLEARLSKLERESRELGHPSAAAVTLFGKDGTVIWRAP